MSRTVVLTYHAIGSTPEGSSLRNTFVPLPTFESQMEFLSRRRRVVGLEDIAAEANGGGPVRVAITFDDAYRSVLTRALAVLERHQFPATVFVPTAWVGDRNRWDPVSGPELELMSAAELSELSERGFQVGSHGHRHIDLARASEQEIREDLASSVSRIAELLGAPPRFLAYPYGHSSQAARRIAGEIGFEEAFALEWEDRPYARSRTPIFPRDSGWRYAFKASGRYAGFRRSRPVSITYGRLVQPLLRD